MKQTETSPSLLLRIRDPRDADAWNEFSGIYRPAIVRLAKLMGLQNADAEDLAQQVLISVARKIETWNHDPERARFRTWLNRITQNAVINAVTRAAPDRATGRSDVLALLDQSPAVSGAESRLLTIELRREVFRYAATRIRDEFHDATWQAFWLTAVDGQPVDVAARMLDKHRGSIYAARSRVMRRLKEKIHELQIIDGEQENDQTSD